MEKKTYLSPCIELITLDNEISLQLQSEPPVGPGETSLSPEFIKTDPFNLA